MLKNAIRKEDFLFCCYVLGFILGLRAHEHLMSEEGGAQRREGEMIKKDRGEVKMDHRP